MASQSLVRDAPLARRRTRTSLILPEQHRPLTVVRRPPFPEYTNAIARHPRRTDRPVDTHRRRPSHDQPTGRWRPRRERVPVTSAPVRPAAADGPRLAVHPRRGRDRAHRRRPPLNGITAGRIAIGDATGSITGSIPMTFLSEVLRGIRRSVSALQTVGGSSSTAFFGPSVPPSGHTNRYNETDARTGAGVPATVGSTSIREPKACDSMSIYSWVLLL